MAASNRILALDLGTQTVALAEFQGGRDGGLVLVNYRTSELLGDPAVDATRLAQAKISVGELVSSMGLKGSKVNYAVSSQSVFTRFVKLPSVGEEQVDQIVEFEAQQNVPFPINEVVWDYQLVDQGNSSEVEVVLVAIKSDLLDEINDSVTGSSLNTAVVDVSPMAIYNAYRFNYGDVPDCSLIIDIGSRTTNLIFVEPRKVFSRSIPIGGSKITEAIAKDFGEPFAVAEERKRRDGFVSLGGSYQDPDDPDVARVSKVVRNTMTRLHAEISRSISFYRSQQQGSAPARVLLCGGTATLPYMREFFHEKLQLPVEFFNPLRNVQVAANLDAEVIGRTAHTLGELVGLALRGALACPMELNLRPASVVRQHKTAERIPYFILAGACLWLILVGFWMYYSKAAAAAQVVIDDMEPKVATLRGFEGQINRVKSAIREQEETAAPLVQAVSDRQWWNTLNEEIHSRLPAKFVWLTGLQESVDASAPEPAPSKGSKGGKAPEVKPRTFLLKGLYLENPNGPTVVDQFIDKLNESPMLGVDKDNLIRNTPTDTDWAYEFSFPIFIKGPETADAAAAKK